MNVSHKAVDSQTTAVAFANAWEKLSPDRAPPADREEAMDIISWKGLSTDQEGTAAVARSLLGKIDEATYAQINRDFDSYRNAATKLLGASGTGNVEASSAGRAAADQMSRAGQVGGSTTMAGALAQSNLHRQVEAKMQRIDALTDGNTVGPRLAGGQSALTHLAPPYRADDSVLASLETFVAQWEGQPKNDLTAAATAVFIDSVPQRDRKVVSDFLGHKLFGLEPTEPHTKSKRQLELEFIDGLNAKKEQLSYRELYDRHIDRIYERVRSGEISRQEAERLVKLAEAHY